MVRTRGGYSPQSGRANPSRNAKPQSDEPPLNPNSPRGQSKRKHQSPGEIPPIRSPHRRSQGLSPEIPLETSTRRKQTTKRQRPNPMKQVEEIPVVEPPLFLTLPPVVNAAFEKDNTPPHEEGIAAEEDNTTPHEEEGLVPNANMNDIGGCDGLGDSDRVVPPGDTHIGCDLVEVEVEDMAEHFGVNEEPENANMENSDSDDDIIDDDKIPEPLSSDDEDEYGDKRETRNPDAAQFTDERDEILSLGMFFDTPEDFRIALLKYSLKTRYNIKLYRSQAFRIGAKCNDKYASCQWRCYASYEKKKQKMQVKVYVDTHSCVRSGYTRLLKQGTIAWLFSERLKADPDLTKHEMVAEIKREYNLVVNAEVCGKAKTILTKKRKQSHEAHFSRVWDYQAEVLQSNEGSTFEIETIPGPSIGSKQRFYRLYVCFKAQRDTWKNSCRPIIGLDGAFLKWDIKGHLLAAVGRDADNKIVPIAWAVVEIENDDNWDWFVRLLSMNLELGDGRNHSIISDKQKGLVKAIHTILPRAEHRQCARHIMDNWKRDNHDMELQRLFWKIARSYNQGEFNTNMDALQNYNLLAYQNLLLTNPATWSRAFFRIGTCCDDVLNNLCESFNRTIKQARRKSILELLEDIRRQCMVRNEKRSKIPARLETKFTKKAHIEIEKMVAGSQFCIRFRATNNLYEVQLQGVGYRVDMNDGTCGCRKWQMTGIPCVHVAAVIIGMKKKVEDYVHECYSTETRRLTYQDGIGPVQGEPMWPRLNRLGVLPPPWRKSNRGRPSKHARRKGPNEPAQSTSRISKDGRVMTCSKCRKEGHNKTTCDNARVEVEKRPRGRPRKQACQPELHTSQQTQAGQAQVPPDQSSQQTQAAQAPRSQDAQDQGLQAQGSQATVEDFIRSVLA